MLNQNLTAAAREPAVPRSILGRGRVTSTSDLDVFVHYFVNVVESYDSETLFFF